MSENSEEEREAWAQRAWAELGRPGARVEALWETLEWAARMGEDEAWGAAERLMDALNAHGGGDLHGEVFGLLIIAATPKLAGAGLEMAAEEETDDEGGYVLRDRVQAAWPYGWAKGGLLGLAQKEAMERALRSLAREWDWAEENPGWDIAQNIERSKERFCSGLSEGARLLALAALGPLVEARWLDAACGPGRAKRAGRSL